MSTKVDLNIRRTVAFTRRLSRWLRKAGVEQVSAVDFSDIIFAAKEIECELEELILLEPNRARDEDRALSHVANLYCGLFEEIGYHLRALKKGWPELDGKLHLARRKPRRKASSPAPRQRAAVKEEKRRKSVK